MSDSFQSYVFRKPDGASESSAFKRVAAWLVASQIVGEETADNTLEGKGYVPGARAAIALKADGGGWRDLAINGVVFASGRIVETSSEWEFCRCPQCGNSIAVDPDAAESQAIYDALDSFHEGKDDGMRCPRCGSQSMLSDWDCGHGLALGEAKVTFWNWPELVDDFPTQLAVASGMTCRKVWGRT